jgi:hypothetical protein
VVLDGATVITGITATAQSHNAEKLLVRDP